jgi:hypothetical protein
MHDRPLFIVLRRQWFDAFSSGSKTDEWRLYGPRWNEDTCRIGRRVVLSLGYTQTRLYGAVIGFRVRKATIGTAKIYGEGAICAVIKIRLDSAM